MLKMLIYNKKKKKKKKKKKILCIGGKLKPRHIPGTVGTHQRLRPGTLDPLSSHYSVSPALVIISGVQYYSKPGPV